MRWLPRVREALAPPPNSHCDECNLQFVWSFAWLWEDPKDQWSGCALAVGTGTEMRERGFVLHADVSCEVKRVEAGVLAETLIVAKEEAGSHRLLRRGTNKVFAGYVLPS